MNKIDLIALRGVKGVKDGAHFREKPNIARALIQIKRARRAKPEEIPDMEILTTEAPDLVKREVKSPQAPIEVDLSKEDDKQKESEHNCADQDQKQPEPEPELEKTPPQIIEATQAAKDAAEELGINLSDVKGTGESGRITKIDVVEFAENENSRT